jgi:small conductance mechanosensitive channel
LHRFFGIPASGIPSYAGMTLHKKKNRHSIAAIRRSLPVSLCLAQGLLVAVFLAMGPALAQDAETSADVTPEAPAQPVPLTDEQVAELDGLRDRIITQRERIADLEIRARRADEPVKAILETRLERGWIDLLDFGLQFVEGVVAIEDGGFDGSVYRSDVVVVLEVQGDVADNALERIREDLTLPGSDLSAAEQAVGYKKFFDLLEIGDAVYEIFQESLAYGPRFGADVSDEQALLKERIIDRALSGSVFLELSVEEVDALRMGVDALPDDAELKAKLTIADSRVQQTAQALERIMAQMDVIGLDTAEYREQVLTVTGEITADVLDVGLVAGLVSRWGAWLLDLIATEGPTFAFQLLLFIVIIFGFRKLAQVVEVVVQRGLRSSKFQLSQLLKRMIASMVRNLIVVFGIMIALSQLGISLGPLLAGLGIAGFVIGFALQDSLSNFASGMMILIYRPFDVGDLVEIGGVFGKVNQMSLVNTTVLTLDNQTVVLPNNMIWSGVIKNVTEQSERRVDMTFGISYGDDIPNAERVLTEIVDAHDKVLDDPEPTIKLHELGDSSVNFIVRPWVKSDDYWDVYWDITRAVKMRFDEEGVSIPFPQRDVHLYSESPTGGDS